MWLSENLKVIKELRNANGKRGGDNTLVGGDLVDVASSPYRNHFLMRSLNGNGDGDNFVQEWNEDTSYVLPSWFNFASALISARDMLMSFVDENKGISVIPESEDKNVASRAPLMMLISGPPMQPGQIFSARSPCAGVQPSQKENYIQHLPTSPFLLPPLPT